MQAIHHNQLYWSCRRGMLELDLLLLPFLEHRYAELTAPQQQVFIDLLTYTDPELYHWLMGAGVPEEPHLAELIQFIQQYAKSTTGPKVL